MKAAGILATERAFATGTSSMRVHIPKHRVSRLVRRKQSELYAKIGFTIDGSSKKLKTNQKKKIGELIREKNKKISDS